MIVMYSTEVLPEVRKTMKYFRTFVRKYFRTKILSYFQKVQSTKVRKYICTVRNYVVILPYYGSTQSTFVPSYQSSGNRYLFRTTYYVVVGRSELSTGKMKSHWSSHFFIPANFMIKVSSYSTLNLGKCSVRD